MHVWKSSLIWLEFLHKNPLQSLFSCLNLTYCRRMFCLEYIEFQRRSFIQMLSIFIQNSINYTLLFLQVTKLCLCVTSTTGPLDIHRSSLYMFCHFQYKNMYHDNIRKVVIFRVVTF